MDISWYGHSCFRLSERGQLTVVTDPFSDVLGLPVPKLKGDVVTISHHSPGHDCVDAVKGYRHVLDGPGEYEIGGVFLTGVALHHIHDSGGVAYNVAFVTQYNALSVVHLGDLAHIPTQATIEALGEVTVALVPVGGGKGLKAAQAAEIIAMIEPYYIVPMHYALPGLTVELDPVDKFLKEMGISRVQEEDVLRISDTTLPEQPQVILLRPQQ
ncbi:MBL fold metallo-hydrolase [bacterium]|nr:MBL fold metallo-hydrolase [bacterium]